MNFEVDWNNLLQEYAIPWAIKLALALVVYVVGRWIAKLIVAVVRRVMQRAKMDEILINFMCSILAALLTVVVVVAALDQLGLNTTSLVAVLGAAGLAVGLALQDSLKNFAAGVMLILFRPFKTGDYVEAAGVGGSVEELAVFWTRLKTPDNKMVIVSNGDIIASSITNYSANDTRRVDMVFGIGYDDDLDQARQLIEEVVTGHSQVLQDPAPTIALAELADSSVNFVVRPWSRTEDYWKVKFEITEQIKRRFDQAGVSIPYPQMDIHLNKLEAQDSPAQAA
ncbi:MAG: mechanosensitive ion channel domain-containing protein [Pseudomonadota bacterium]